ICADAIIEILQHKNLKKYIHSHNVYNLIQQTRCQSGTTSDAGLLYLSLMKEKQENPTFYIDARFEDQDNHLVSLCWMRLSQQKL
ncbi:17766_t:CDS:1, partial [Racocetra fulgida]